MKRIVTFFLTIVLVIPLLAQNGHGNAVTRNNIYKIDDRLYEIYQRADRARSSSECLAICDTLCEEAVKLDDGKAECLGYVLKMMFWSRQLDIEALNAAADKVREVSKKNNYPQYYYQAYSQQSVTYMNLQRFDEAKTIINRLYEDAMQDDSPYGLYNCYIQNAHLFNFQGSYHKAMNEYVLAAQFMADNIPDQSPSTAYLHACKASLWDYNFENALLYSRKGLEYLCDSNTKTNLYGNQGVALFLLGRTDEFKDVFASYEHEMNISGQNYIEKKGPVLAAKYAIDGKYDEAVEVLESVDNLLKNPMLRLIYEMRGEYKKALAQADSSLSIIKNYFQHTTELSTAEMTGLLDTERYEAENKALELKGELKVKRLIIIFLCTLILLGGIIVGIILQNKRKHIKLLKQANEVKDKFVKNFSHEVRTPLNAIIGYSQMLADPETLTEKEREEFVSAVVENGDALAVLIDDILSASDILEGTYNVKIEDTSLLNICTSAVKTAGKRLPKGVKMNLETEISEDLTIRTDAVRVQQILINLLNNSCKNTSEGSITLSCNATDDKITFKVMDSGCGIPEEKAEDIFEPFFKIDEFKQGVGLGLSISRDIASRLGGTLTLDTQYNGGSQFILELPVK